MTLPPAPTADPTPADHRAAVTHRAHERGLTGVRPLANGLEFVAYRAADPAGRSLVLRAPRGQRFQSNANDPHVDTRALLRWEETITRHLAGHGIPVARPVELALGDPDLLISHYVPDDGHGADPAGLGTLLARLHRAPLPPAAPVAAEGVPVRQLLPRRIVHRWQQVATLVPDLPALPPRQRLARVLADRPDGSLLHLDVRAANLRCVRGTVQALLDWSNALVGDPALELARLTEFAALPENGLDLDAMLAAYGPAPGTAHPSFPVYRLDAAVMLAVVFLFEAPDPGRGADAVERLLQVHRDVMVHLA